MARQDQQSAASVDGNIATAKDVLAALAAIGLPQPSRPTLEAISTNCRDTFLEALRACITKKDTEGSNRAYVENILACLDPSASATLRKIGLHVEPPALVAIVGFRPARFRSALAIAADQSHERYDEAIAFLRHLVEAKPWMQPQQVSSISSPIYDIPGMPPDPESIVPASAPLQVHRGEHPIASVRNAAVTARLASDDRNMQSQPVSSEPSSGKTQPSTEKFRSHHVYGSDFALCFNASTSVDGKPSIMIDAAAANGQRSYDWKSAIHIMLDVREVTCVLAAFRKWRPQVEFSAHGKRNDKSFSLAWQGPHFYCKVSAKMDHKPVRAVKIMPHDAIQVAMLFLEQLLLAYPNVPASEVLELARSVNTFDGRNVAHQ